MILNYTKSQIERLLLESDSFREFIIKLGYKSAQSYIYKNVRRHLEQIGVAVNFENFKYSHRVNTREASAKSDVEMFQDDTKFSNQMKSRIVKRKLLPYECECCKNDGIWNGKELTLHLDHKNGNRTDNRLVNFRFLCPNCHTQTGTYAGRNIKKKSPKTHLCDCGKKIWRTSKKCKECQDINQRKETRPVYDILLEDIKKLGYKSTGKKYNVTDSAIRKWIKSYEKK